MATTSSRARDTRRRKGIGAIRQGANPRILRENANGSHLPSAPRPRAGRMGPPLSWRLPEQQEPGVSEPMRLMRDGAVARLRLERPELHNAFDDALVAALTRALEGLATDPAIRVVVLEGAGTSFSAGADLNWMRGMAAAGEDANRADALALAHLLRTLDELPKPTIARVHGAAFGGGVGLVAACDIAIGVPEAKFGLTESRLGLLPAVISPYVVAAIGS